MFATFNPELDMKTNKNGLLTDMTSRAQAAELLQNSAPLSTNAYPLSSQISSASLSQTIGKKAKKLKNIQEKIIRQKKEESKQLYEIHQLQEMQRTFELQRSLEHQRIQDIQRLNWAQNVLSQANSIRYGVPFSSLQPVINSSPVPTYGSLNPLLASVPYCANNPYANFISNWSPIGV